MARSPKRRYAEKGAGLTRRSVRYRVSGSVDTSAVILFVRHTS